MGKKALKKICESLREENEFLHDRIFDLEKQINLAYCGNSKLCKELDAEKINGKEKYSALLEKYIDMMEKTSRINEPAPDEMIVLLLDEVGGLILKWQVDNAYDQQLDIGFAKIKEKYMGGRRK